MVFRGGISDRFVLCAKKSVACCYALLFYLPPPLVAFAVNQVNSIDIQAVIHEDGSMRVTQSWLGRFAVHRYSYWVDSLDSQTKKEKSGEKTAKVFRGIWVFPRDSQRR